LITDVRYVPELNGNVLSVRALTKKEISWKFDGEKCAVMQRNDSVTTADAKQQLYELNCTHKAKLTGFAKNDNCLHTLHRRFGHRDPNSIKLLEKKCLVSGMHIGKCNKTILCDTCIKRKMEILPFPKVSTTKRKSMFDLEHRDWCGPIETQTPGGKRYVLTLIDDYSRSRRGRSVHVLTGGCKGGSQVFPFLHLNFSHVRVSSVPYLSPSL
jgi:hypothetical protein